MHQYRVGVIGNSNSIAVTSYARILAAQNGIDLRNDSIGGNPNIVLLSFLTQPDLDLSNLDVIIVETAVIESLHLKDGNTYTAAESRDNIDLFMRSVKTLCSARIVFLILPTLFGLLEPKHYFAEQHYTDCARRHGATILNVYQIIRQLGKLDPNGPPPDLLRKVDNFVSAFNLRNRDTFAFRWWLRQHPAELHGAFIGTKALAEHALEDVTHISRPIQAIIADLLYRWITQHAPAGEQRPRQTTPETLAMRCLPTMENIAPIVRESSFMSRQLIPIDPTGTAVYPCGPRFRAAGLLVNEYRTRGFITLSSPLGEVTIDARFPKRDRAWNAMIILIPGEIGGGDIRLTISSEASTAVYRHDYLTVAAPDGPTEALGEVGEMLLVRRDWRTAAEHPAAEHCHDHPAEPNIEALDWARSIIEATGITAAQAIDGIRRGNIVIARPAFANCVDPRSTPTEATLLAAAGEVDAALAALAASLAEAPEDPALCKMRQSLMELRQGQ